MRLDDLEGRVVAGRFRLREMIGKGGYGAVFEAEQLSVGRRCAVKVLLPGRSADEAVDERFRAEARMTSRLTHPNSLVLYDFGVDEESGFLFLATEYLDGKTLHGVIEQEKMLGVERTLFILEQMAGSLADAHRHGLVHRDIKPKNVMLMTRAGQEDFVKVIDFGIAKTLSGAFGADDGLTKTGMLIGTPQYMAPEQLLGTGLDERVDQYALAVLGYKMLTGRNPFKAATPMETAMRHINERALPLRTYRPELEVSSTFEDVFLKALEKSAEHRYQSVTAFVDALGEAHGKVVRMKKMAAQKATVRLDSVREIDLLLASAPPAGGAAVNVQKVQEVTGATAVTRLLSKGEARKREGEELEEFDEAEEELAPIPAEMVARPRREEATTAVVGVSARDVRPLSLVVLTVAGGAALLLFGALILLVISGSTPQVEEGDGEQAIGADRGAATVEMEGDEALDEAQVAKEKERVDLQPVMSKGQDFVLLAREEAQVQAVKAEEERARRLARRPGRVAVTLIPWGTLFIDGEEQSNATRQEVRLRPGRYEFSLRQKGQERARRTVDVEAGASKIVVLEAQFDR